MMRRMGAACVLWLLPAWLSAQPAPTVVTTLKVTSGAADGLCVGCPAGTVTPAANSGLKAVTMTIPSSAPSVTTDKLYQVSGAPRFNGLNLVTASVGGGAANTISMFNADNQIANSLLTQSGSTVTMTGSFTTTAALTAGTTLTTPVLLLGAGAAGSDAGPSIWAFSNQLFSVGGTSGFVWNNQNNTTNLMTLTNAGLFTLNGAAAHTITGTVSGRQSLQIRNTSANAAAFSEYAIGNDSGAFRSFIDQFSSTFTPSGPYKADGLAIEGDGAGGVSLVAGHATTGVLRGYTGGTTQRFQYDISGNYSLGSGTNVTDGVATPTFIGGTCGTSPAIAGKAHAFRITVGSGGTATTCGVDFNQTFANAPVCTVSGNAQTINTKLVLQISTTQLTVVSVSVTAGTALAFSASDVLTILCRGF